MNLLTNEQIEELTRLHDEWWDGNESFQEYLSDWNEKQTGIQFYVNWNNAPPSASRAELTISWHNNDKFLVSEDLIGYIPRPITPHPHAEIIMKYAEVAQRRADPCVEFEIYNDFKQEWQKMNPNSLTLFDIKFKYRHIGETK